MTWTSDAMGHAPSVATTRPAPGVRPFFWSVRRELWEHRSIYIAPAVVGALVVAAALIGAVRRGSRAVVPPPPVGLPVWGDAPVESAILLPFVLSAAAITLTGALVGLFYCLAALNHERRDRSVLFWKSLPVSNVTTVASKMFTVMVVLPVCVYAALLATNLVLLAIAAANLVAHGDSLDVLTQVPLLQAWLRPARAIIASWLWWAPVYGWALLASAWAKRMALLWAVLPPIGLMVFERLAFDTRHVETVVGDRLRGNLTAAFTLPAPLRDPVHHRINLPDVDLLGFIARPDLWAGLAVAALFVAAAVWLRRRAEPV
jgi:ABC-2 type transport system permease protein